MRHHNSISMDCSHWVVCSGTVFCSLNSCRWLHCLMNIIMQCNNRRLACNGRSNSLQHDATLTCHCWDTVDGCAPIALDALALLELGVVAVSLLLAAEASPLMQVSRLFMTHHCALDFAATLDDPACALLLLHYCCHFLHVHVFVVDHPLSGVVFLLLFDWIHGKVAVVAGVYFLKNDFSYCMPDKWNEMTMLFLCSCQSECCLINDFLLLGFLQ